MDPQGPFFTEQQTRHNGGDSPSPPPIADSTPVPIPDPDEGILTPEKARAARERAHADQRFHLTRTGGYALVRRLTATDRVAIGNLPSHQQQIVLNALARASDNANARKADGSISRPIALENMKRQEELVNAYCVAGFVRPRLILSENDRADPDEVLVTDLDMKDREAFFAWCETDSEAAARRVAAFPDGPLPGLGLG